MSDSSFHNDIGTAVGNRHRHRRAAATPGPSLVLAGLALLFLVGLVLSTSDPNSALMATGVFDLVLGGWLISLAMHQFVQAWIAFRVGDVSLLRQGYLALDPMRYSDALLVMVMPTVFVLFGGVGMAMGAVWLVGSHIHGRARRALAALAGPVVNFGLALLLSVAYAFAGQGTEAVGLRGALAYLAMLQLMAAVLSLLPVPGLDGYEMVSPWLPHALTSRLNRARPYGPLALFVVLLPPPVNEWLTDAVRTDLAGLGISPTFVELGRDAFRFWQFTGL